MRRRLFTLATAVSAVLCAAACGLWVRSYWVGDGIVHMAMSPEEHWAVRRELRSDAGVVRLERIVWEFEKPDGLQLLRDDLPAPALGWAYDGGEPRRYTFPDTTAGRFRFSAGTDRMKKRAHRIRPVRADVGMFTMNRMSLTWPHWLLVLLTAAPGGVWCLQRRPWRRCRPGRCAACGYDLRATPGRCPECGTVATAHETPADGGGGSSALPAC